MKVHRPKPLSDWQELELSLERVKAAALHAGLDYEGFHQLTDDTWAHLYHRAYSAARTGDHRYAGLLRTKWRSHALHRIAQHKTREENK